jgi:thiosulfate/3-mercaptopyruvate sulfurtransferase
LGHDAVAVLDGGYPAWIRKKLPVKSGEESRASRSFVPEVREGMKIELDQIETLVGSNEVLLLDARAPERYRGEVEPFDRIAGHIPGALNHFWETNLDQEGYFLPKETLRERYLSILKETPTTAVIGYCGSGVTSCHNLLAMEYCGLSGARLYPGSWSEWCADPTHPTTNSD